jgi:ribosomal protein S18 acetylase RimI-like enzyme
VAGLGNPDRPIGGLAVRTPPGVELLPLGRDHQAAAVGLARRARSLPPLDDLEPVRQRWDELVNDVDTVGFLAADSGEAAGLAVMRLRRRLNFATFEGWISDLALADEAPGGPIAAALVQALVAEWRLRGGHRILASVASGDDVARQALRGAGFEEGLVDFRLAPVPPVAVVELPGVVVRPVAAADADAVTRLIAEFGPRRSPVPDRMEAVHRTFAAHVREVEAGKAASVVAEQEDVVVGVCTLEWQRSFWADELHAWIPDLVVTEPVRGRGIGRLLLVDALRTAREAGAAEVRLESGAHRAAAHGLYRSIGFTETGWTWMLLRDDQ